MTLPEDYINRPVRSLQTMLQVLSNVFPALLNVNPDGIYGETNPKSRPRISALFGSSRDGDRRAGNLELACKLLSSPRAERPAAGALAHCFAARAGNLPRRTESAPFYHTGHDGRARWALLQCQSPGGHGRFRRGNQKSSSGIAGALRPRADRRDRPPLLGVSREALHALHRRRHGFYLFRRSVCTQQISAVKHSGSWAAPPTEGAREFRWDGL